MHQILLSIHVFVAVLLIVLVLLQHGKGADAGASFGGGASGTMFGSKGATPFLVKVTTVLAVLFFTTSLSLTYLGSRGVKKSLLQVPEILSQAQKLLDNNQEDSPKINEKNSRDLPMVAQKSKHTSTKHATVAVKKTRQIKKIVSKKVTK